MAARSFGCRTFERRADPASSPWQRAGLCAAGAALLFVQVGCGGGSKQDFETQPAPPTQIAPVVEPPPPPLPPPIREVQPKTRPKVKVIDPGVSDSEQPSLYQASQRAKELKRQGLQQPVHEITDENLAEYAEGAEVIMLESPPAADLPTTDEMNAASASAGGDIRGEDYWRNRGLQLRMSWRDTIDEIAKLSLEAAALRQQFYAEDDPYIRDSQIKPNWDRVVDRLRALKEQSDRYRRELDTYVDEGRGAGALQGWLNEGWEIQPTEDELSVAVGTSSINHANEPNQTNPGVDISDDPDDEGG